MPYKRCLLAVNWATVTRQERERERDIGVVITIRYSMFFGKYAMVKAREPFHT